ncbi:biotin/lipoyl-binding protein [Sphingomonas sp. SUN019]|uniref:biotin/lipoyl-containing protein n=1 Tax=Sphingomonas sp. SUN019 TaxID=2937788 RepID=UPI0021645CEC|nr:biotin/lipoyl-containing protein [Sphingomonas sp. SUN019]UVO49674.1 biotin/lipoyl-binding protein [Sphingomonas sp. SUN019]
MAKVTLKLPKLAASMQEGTIVEWLVVSGDRVETGQPLYVIETEKTSTEIASPVAGAISLIAEAGQVHRIGTPIATVET